MKNESLTVHEREFVRTNEAVREAIHEETGDALITIYQQALYRPHLLFQNKTALRIIREHMANPIVNVE